MHTTNVGVIGTGRIGKPMARNLLQAGYPVHVHDVRQEAYADLVAVGASYQPSPRAVADASELILLSLTTVEIVEQVLFGRDGVAQIDLHGKIVIDTSTGQPATARRFAGEVARLGGSMLDAPITGGEGGAAAGTLNIMVGGDERAFARCRELLGALGGTVVLVGPSGAGQVAKMANQMLLSGYFATIVETFAYVERAGIDVEAVLEAIETGGARSPQLSGLGRAYRQRRAAPPDAATDEAGAHYLALYHKDIHYALLEGYRQGSWMPVTAAVHELFKRASAAGGHGSWPIRLLDLWRDTDESVSKARSHEEDRC